MSKLGFRLARSKGMEGSTGNLHEFPIDPANTTPIFRGDLVTLNGGFVEVSDGAASAKILGIFWGVSFTDVEGNIVFNRMWRGNTGASNIRAHVALMPAGATMFVGVDDTAIYTAADIGTLKEAAAGPGGNIVTGFSSQILGAPGASVANAPLIVLKFLDKNMDDIIPEAAGDAIFAEVAVAAPNAVELAGA